MDGGPEVGTCLLHLDSSRAGGWGGGWAAGSGAEPYPAHHQVTPILHPVLLKTRLPLGRAEG